MLRKFQKYEKQILFGLVIVVALAFGITSDMLAIFSRDKAENLAGEIMGRKVSKEEFQAKRNQCVVWTQCWLAHANDNYKILSFISPFDMVDPELYNKKRDDYFDELTWVVLMLDAMADKSGVRVSPREVVDYIKSNLFLFSTREEGFLRERYQWILSNWRVSEVFFEEVAASFLKLRKYRELVLSGVIPNTRDIYDEFVSQYGEIMAAWIPFEGNDYKDKVAGYDEPELSKYFEEHAEEYRVTEKVQIEYIMAKIDEVKKGLAEPNEEEFQDYYNKHREKEFPTKSFAEARDEIKDVILSGLAGERSLDMVAKAEDQITLLELQEKPINFKSLAEKFGLSYQLSGFFDDKNPGELMGDLGESSLFLKQIRNFQENELSRSLSTSKGHFIFRLLKRQESYIPQLEGALKDKVVIDYVSHKAKLAAKSAAENMLHGISDKVDNENQGKSGDEKFEYELRIKWIEELARELKIESRLGRTLFVRKNDDLTLIKSVGNDFKDKLFKMRKGEFSLIEDGEVYYLVQILDRRVPAAGSFDAEKETIASGMASKKKDDFSKNWLQDIKVQVKWKNYLDVKSDSGN